jgi:hypothetical protein
VTLQVMHGMWDGLGPGHGRLRRREVTITARGRGAAARPREITLWMPGLVAPPPIKPPPTAVLPTEDHRTDASSAVSLETIPTGPPSAEIASTGTAPVGAPPASVAAAGGGAVTVIGVREGSPRPGARDGTPAAGQPARSGSKRRRTTLSAVG